MYVPNCMLIHWVCRSWKASSGAPRRGTNGPADPRCVFANRLSDSQSEQHVAVQHVKML